MIPDRGRVVYIQATQVLRRRCVSSGHRFTKGDNIAEYELFWAFLGVGQGLNPPVHRLWSPVAVPELRGQAFAIWLTTFETIGWALFSLDAGELAASRNYMVFLWILVVLMPVSAAVLPGLYFTYSQDVERVEGVLERRRAEALRTSAGARVGASAQIDAGSESI